MDLSVLANCFDIPGRLVTVQPFGSGNVNDTFLAIFRNTFSEHQVVLQRLNTNIFPQPDIIMRNLRNLTAHVHKRLEAEAETVDRVWQMPRIIPTRGGDDYIGDGNGGVWRAITRIPSATAFDEPQGTEFAQECGAVLGHFHWLVSDLAPETMADPLPGFHISPQYLAAYDRTLQNADAQERLNASLEARRLAHYIEDRRACVTVLQDALQRGELTLRLMHGDPKSANIMIDDFTGKGTAIIDLDTVSPGLIHYDFGDALRSICNHAGENATNLATVVFDLDLCAAFCKGYIAHAAVFLSDADKHYLYDAIRLMTFELGLRFFQDYLAGNVYFKTRTPEQNLNRARVQFRLCESIESREQMIRQLLAASF